MLDVLTLGGLNIFNVTDRCLVILNTLLGFGVGLNFGHSGGDTILAILTINTITRLLANVLARSTLLVSLNQLQTFHSFAIYLSLFNYSI
ncbi:hypothetical protein WP8W19C02_28170 [Enterobacter cloacae]|nr:hypothetical protein WP8W19C02_28170 [Enterobacter cloacae]